MICTCVQDINFPLSCILEKNITIIISSSGSSSSSSCDIIIIIDNYYYFMISLYLSTIKKKNIIRMIFKITKNGHTYDIIILP